MTASELLYSCFQCSCCSELLSLCPGPAGKLELLCWSLAYEHLRKTGGREGERLMRGRARRQREFFSRKGFLVDLRIAFKRKLVSCSSVRGWDTYRGDPWAVSRLIAQVSSCWSCSLLTPWALWARSWIPGRVVTQHNAEPPGREVWSGKIVNAF